jgi:hypothetical protein
LGRSPLFRRWSGLLRIRLWLWRLLCAASGSNAVGPALAPGEPLLLTSIVRSGRQKRPWPAAAGAFCPIPAGGTERRVRRIFTGKKRIPSAAGNNFRCGDLFLRHLVELNPKRKLSWIANKSIVAPADRSATPSANGCSRTSARRQRPCRPISSICWRSCTGGKAKATGGHRTSSVYYVT